MKIYLAGGIFCYGDLLRNTEWARKVREAFPEVDLYSPVENTEIKLIHPHAEKFGIMCAFHVLTRA